MVKKVVFYYTHYECLGHTSRILSVIHSLKSLSATKINIILINGSRKQDFIKLPRWINQVNLPFPLYSKENFREPPKQDFPKTKSRANFLLAEIKKIKPDVFITEYFPFGHQQSKYELLPVLDYLKQHKKIIICSLGYPIFFRKNLSETKFLLHFYNRIFVHTPENTELNYALHFLKDNKAKKDYKSFFYGLKDKIKFSGYVLPYNLKNSFRSGRRPIELSNRSLVLVTRGAGAYYPKIISSAITAARLLKQVEFLIVSGPSTSDKEWSFFEKLRDNYGLNNISLKKYVPELPLYFKYADVVISTAAYNTSSMLLYYGKRSVVIPFKGYSKNYSFWEQPVRAQMLKRILGSTIIDYERLTPEKVKAAVITQLQRKTKNRVLKPSCFNGGQITAKGILSGLAALT